MTGLYLNSAWELLFYLILSCLAWTRVCGTAQIAAATFISIDETVRTDDSYLIVYAPGQELSGFHQDPQNVRGVLHVASRILCRNLSVKPRRKEDPEQVEMKVTVHNEEVYMWK